MTLAPKYVVLRAVNGHFEMPIDGKEIKSFDNDLSAHDYRVKLLSAEPEAKFAVFALQSLAQAERVVRTQEVKAA